MLESHKHRTISMLKWVSSTFVEKHFISSKTQILPTEYVYIALNPRFYGTKTSVRHGDVGKTSLRVKKEAQSALLEYLHSTRNLQFIDAENMSKNSPHFLQKLLARVENEGDVKRSIARLLRYHPINEFEPFFESLGLKPCDYVPLLPRDLMYLSDDSLLLDNYFVLSNYGIARSRIGKIFIEAMEVLRYKPGVLVSKLQAYEELGLSQSTIGNFVYYCPLLLIGDVNLEFVKVFNILKSVGIEFSWMEKHVLKKNTCNWSLIFDIISLLSKMGFKEEELCALIRQHPELLVEGSGNKVSELVELLLKFGCSVNEMRMIFLQIPQIPIGKFCLNLKRCFLFFSEIEMKLGDIVVIFRSHLMFLGTCNLKKTNSLLSVLNIGKKRLRNYIMENPQELKKWVLGSRIGPLPDFGHKEKSQMLKTKFLEDMGFGKNSGDMEKALEVFRGRGTELQGRFDCIVNAGLDREDVCRMVRISPQILNQTEEVIKSKIDFLVNDLGYAISTLQLFPQYLSYTMQRIQLRLLMYNWLKDEGVADPNLAFSTIITCSDDVFKRRYVNLHARGPEVWRDLRKKIFSGSQKSLYIVS